MATHARQQYFADESSLSKEKREFSIADEIQGKIDSVEEGAQVNKIETVKVNGTALVPDANKVVNVEVPEVIDNLYTVAADDALSAKQGKLLYDYIQNLQTIGRFLSNWDSATGLPITNPSESPYLYKAGDYYRVSNVAVSPALNYKPNGSSFIIGQASTTVETNNINISDLYLYDGTDWILLSNSGSGIAVDSSLSTTSTNPVENRVITNALNNKQDALTAGTGINITSNTISTNWIEVNVATGAGTAAKVGTTTAGNYTPTKGDFLLVNFVNGCGVDNPTLNIDGSGDKNIRTGSANANKSTFALGTTANINIKALLYYDGTYYRCWSTTNSNTTYPAMSVAEGKTGTATSSRTMRADYLKQIIKYHAVSDTAYDSTWDGQTDIAPSKNAVYDKINSMDTIIAGKQDTLTAGTGISIDANNEISNTLPGAIVSATAPSNPTEGMVWYDTTGDSLKAYNGTSWETEGTKMVVLSYGHSTWQDFIDAYNKNAIVYCKASSNSNPGSGNQGRMAFMAYVNINNSTGLPTEVEFQYYRSRSDHNSAANQLDQVFVYKLTSAGAWTVTERNTGAKAVAGTGISLGWGSGNMTISADTSVLATQTDLNSKQDTLVSGTNIKTVNSNSLLGSGDITLNDVKVSATAPSNPTEGMVWYDTINNQLKVYDGTNWNVTGKEYTAGEGIEIKNGPDYSAMQGPAPSGFHVPSRNEWVDLCGIFGNTFVMESDATTMGTYLKMPMAGLRLYNTADAYYVGSSGNYWSSTPVNADDAGSLYFASDIRSPLNGDYRANGLSIRCFKDTPIIPTSSWTTLYDGSRVATGAGIFYNATDGLISISGDGQNWYTIMDKNLGATTVYNQGDALTDANCGYFFQWGNNYGFAHSGTVTTSSTKVDASNYGPGNYYSSSTFITYKGRWDTTDNGNLWGGVTGVVTYDNAIINTGVLSVNGQTGNVAVQETLVSGTNIKTVNSTSLLGSGNIAVQPTLVSGTNIKTINGNSLLGSGNITIDESSFKVFTVTDLDDSTQCYEVYSRVRDGKPAAVIYGSHVFYYTGTYVRLGETKYYFHTLYGYGETIFELVLEANAQLYRWDEPTEVNLGGAEIEYVTQAEYNALPSSKLTDNKHYFIYTIERPDIDSFSLTTSVASGQSRLHAVGISGDGSNIYIGKNTASLSQHTATDGNLSNYSSSTVSSISYQSRGLWCKPDGTKLYDSHDNGDIYQVNMSTPYSLSGSTVSTYATGSKCCGISLSHDGTKLYHGVWDSPKTFYEYTLSVPRDVASRGTAIPHTVDAIQSTSGDGPNIYQTQISPTGKKMYFYADQGMIYQYNLSIPYDWSTATYYGSLNVGFGARGSFQFTEDGKRIILGNLSNKQLYQYDAS